MSAKRKLEKFAQNKTFEHFFEPQFNFQNPSDYEMKANWAKDFFKNKNSLIVELGCGKGEYTVGQAKQYPQNNYIGVDIKGARMWRGASDVLNLGLKNVAFLRTRVEFTPFCFAKNEVSEIWITFPDPQKGPRKRIRKRLTSSEFLSRYQKFLIDDGFVNLKTDDDTLYEYTKSVVSLNNLEVIVDTDNLYESKYYTGALTIKTHYEKMWNQENRIIKYLKFKLPQYLKLIEPPYEE